MDHNRKIDFWVQKKHGLKFDLESRLEQLNILQRAIDKIEYEIQISEACLNQLQNSKPLLPEPALET